MILFQGVKISWDLQLRDNFSDTHVICPSMENAVEKAHRNKINLKSDQRNECPFPRVTKQVFRVKRHNTSTQMAKHRDYIIHCSAFCIFATMHVIRSL